MSASNTNFLQGIVLALKAMWKTCINLSKKVDKIENLQIERQEKIGSLELQMAEVIKQHLEIMIQMKQITILQADMAKQIIAQHHETEALMKGLGLKKDLSYYSFNLHKERGH